MASGDGADCRRVSGICAEEFEIEFEEAELVGRVWRADNQSANVGDIVVAISDSES